MRHPLAVLLLTYVQLGCMGVYNVSNLTLNAPLAAVTVNGASVPVSELGFGDEVIRFTVMEATPGAVLLEMANLGEGTIRVLWDEGSYVNRLGFSSRVVPGESRVIDMARSQPATPIPPQAMARLWAISVGEEPPTPARFPDVERAHEFCAELRGSVVRLVLPIEGAHGRREYSLTLRVESVRLGLSKVDREFGTLMGTSTIECQ